MSLITGSRALAAGVVFAVGGAAAARPDLYSNGPFQTGQGPAGAGVSLLQNTSQFSQVFGFNCQLIPTASRVADDFTVADPGGWTVSSLVFYAFQTGSGTGASTFTLVDLRIWSGRPGDPGSTVVFGDTTTNLISGSAWTGCYRARESDPGDTTRPIFWVEAAVSPPLHLAPGTYWLDWQTSGTIASGPWAVPVTILGLPAAPNANARAFVGPSGPWINARDTGNQAQQELAFTVRGTPGSPAACYANCDASTTPPVLNVADFTCFLNQFASGHTYANCDGSTTPPTLNVGDFTCFLNAFAAGCSGP